MDNSRVLLSGIINVIMRTTISLLLQKSFHHLQVTWATSYPPKKTVDGLQVINLNATWRFIEGNVTITRKCLDEDWSELTLKIMYISTTSFLFSFKKLLL